MGSRERGRRISELKSLPFVKTSYDSNIKKLKPSPNAQHLNAAITALSALLRQLCLCRSTSMPRTRPSFRIPELLSISQGGSKPYTWASPTFLLQCLSMLSIPKSSVAWRLLTPFPFCATVRCPSPWQLVSLQPPVESTFSNATFPYSITMSPPLTPSVPPDPCRSSV